MGYALIFDMDGVIIDSNPFHRISWGNFLRRKGIPYSEEIFNNVLSGKTGETSLRILIDPDLADQQIYSYLREIDGEFQDIFRNTEEVKSVPGVQSFLDRAIKMGIKTALATSAPPGNVDLIMERLHLRDYFNVILDSTDVSQGKPHPEVYQKAVEGLGLPKENCIVFEDSRAGIQSARGAGLKVVGVTSSHTKAELLEEGVDLVVEDFNGLDIHEILNLLQ